MGKGGLIAVLALAGCETPASTPPAAPAADPMAVTRPVGVRVVNQPEDLCRAGELQWLVGKPKTDIPVPVEVSNRRVTCTTCPVTEDYSPQRLNIFFNDQTGLVEQVRCG